MKLGQLAHAGKRKRPETFREWLLRTRQRTFRTGYEPDEPPLTFLPPEETTDDA